MSAQEIERIATELNDHSVTLFQYEIGIMAVAVMEARSFLADDDIASARGVLRKIEIVIGQFDRVRQGVLAPMTYELTRALEGLRSEIAEAGVQAAAHRAHPLTDKAVREQVWELTDGRCAYCDKHLRPFGTGSDSFVVEHVVPKSAGGPDNIANYVPACMACNSTKSDGHVVEFIRARLERRPMLRVVNAPSTTETDHAESDR